MRDRLIEMIQDSVQGCARNWAEIIADYLLAEGVIVPPCKVGQTVYVVSRYYGGIWQMYECYVDSLTVYNADIVMSLKSTDGWYNFEVYAWEIGKNVFLTRKEAKKELERRSKNNA